jgi:hypothetical protein
MRMKASICGVVLTIFGAIGVVPVDHRTAHAQAGFVVNTSFDCPDWDQLSGTDPCPQDSAIERGGDWTGSSGRGDLITLAANNPLGIGRGFRHWRDSGTNSGGGGIRVGFPPTTQVWVRVYMRYAAGFGWVGGHPNYTKDLYFNPGTSNFRILGFSGNNLYVHFAAGSNNVLSSDTWDGINGGSLGDGRFHCYEIYMKVDTNGSNGEAKIWRDGNLVLNRTGQNLGGGVLSFFLLGSNQSSVVGSNLYTDYDDLVVSTTGYIGPIGGSSSSAPTAPSNLRITS